MVNDIGKEISLYRKSFHELYNNVLKYMTKDLERYRISLLNKLFVVEVCLFIPLLLLIYPMIKFNSPLLAILIGMLGVVIVVYPISTYLGFRHNIKQQLTPIIFNIFENLSRVNSGESINDVCITQSNLFARYTSRNNDDAFKGVYKNINFAINELSLSYTVNDSQGRYLNGMFPVFKGVLLNLQINKNIKNNTIIATKTDANIKNQNIIIYFVLMFFVFLIYKSFNLSDIIIFLFVVLVIMYEIISGWLEREGEHINEITLEDPEFNKRYRAYSGDEVEGRYLITPAFMERFKNLQTAFKSDKVKCSFYNNYLMFAISTRDNCFELGNLFSRLDNPKIYQKFFDELISIYLIIDYFKLGDSSSRRNPPENIIYL